MKPRKFTEATYWLLLTALLGVCGQIIGGDGRTQTAPARPASSLEYWLDHADTRPARTEPAERGGVDPFARRAGHPSCALPGAVQMSDGRVLAGWLYTTEDKPIKVFADDQKRWRLVPLAATLSISAVVVEAKLEQAWRWKEMAAPQRVYTGKSYPARRLTWRIKLADGSEIVGAVKGQAVFLVSGARSPRALILHERQRGRDGQELADLVYLRKLVVSRRAMEQFASGQAESQPASRPAR